MEIDKSVQRPGSDGLIYFLDFDAGGRLWVGTQHGVDMWDGAHWTHYDMNDGLAWDDCNLNGFAAGPDGAVWIGTSGGLSRFKPLPREEPKVPIAVVFTRLSVGQNDVSGMANPSFGSRSNPLIARYSALNASRQNEVVFRYRLGVAGTRMDGNRSAGITVRRPCPWPLPFGGPGKGKRWRMERK